MCPLLAAYSIDAMSHRVTGRVEYVSDLDKTVDACKLAVRNVVQAISEGVLRLR